MARKWTNSLFSPSFHQYFMRYGLPLIRYYLLLRPYVTNNKCKTWLEAATGPLVSSGLGTLALYFTCALIVQINQDGKALRIVTHFRAEMNKVCFVRCEYNLQGHERNETCESNRIADRSSNRDLVWKYLIYANTKMPWRLKNNDQHT